MQALANYYKPTAGLGAYHRDIQQKAIAGLGSYYANVPQKAIAGFGTTEDNTDTIGGTVGALGLAIRGLAGYYIGSKMASPILGIVLGGIFGVPGLFALTIWKAPAVAVANKRRRRRRARRLARRSR